VVQRHQVLSSPAALRRAIGELARTCEVMSGIKARSGIPSLRDYSADFAGLARIIVGQQLSSASANAIWTRIVAARPAVDADFFSTARDEHLRSLGLSNGKMRTLRALSTCVRDDGLDFAQLNAVDDLAIIERLTAIHGIGPWTANIYLLFALRRADAFPSGDLALQLAAQRLFGLKGRPSANELEELSQRWRPWRGAAARMLWADYSSTGVKASTAPDSRPQKVTVKSKK